MSDKIPTHVRLPDGTRMDVNSTSDHRFSLDTHGRWVSHVQTWDGKRTRDSVTIDGKRVRLLRLRRRLLISVDGKPPTNQTPPDPDALMQP